MIRAQDRRAVKAASKRATMEAALARTRALIEAVRAIHAEGHDLDATLDALVEQGRRLLDAQDVAINLKDPASGLLLRRRPSALVPSDSPFVAVGTPVIMDCFFHEALATRRAVVIQDIHSDPRVEPFIRVQFSNVVGTILAPLVAGDAIVGMMNIRWTEPRSIGRTEVELAEALGQHAAVAVRTARLMAEVQDRAVRRTQTADLTAALAQASTVHEVAGAVLRHAPMAAGAHAGAVFLTTETGDELEVVRAEGYPAELGSRWTRIRLDAPVPAAVAVRNVEPVFLGTREEVVERFPNLKRHGYGYSVALAALPLAVNGRAIGALGFGFAEARTFQPHERESMAGLAGRCALAVERARLYDALRRSEEQHRLVAEAARAAVFELDAASPRILWVGAGRRIFGYPEAAADDFGWWRERVHPDDQDDVVALLSTMALARESCSHAQELRFRSASGVYAHCRLVVRSRPAGEVGPTRVLGMMSDVSELRRAEEERDRLAEALVRVEERQRVAMDLHDGVVQQLFGTGLALSAEAACADGHAAEALSRGAGLVGAASASLRAYLESLQSPTLACSPFSESLSTLVADVARTTSVQITLRVDPAAAEQLSTAAAEDALYVAREAAANAVRHGAPRAVDVDVRRTRGGVILEVRDDGAGFNLLGARRGMGLNNMRRRAAAMGARLTIGSAPGRGTTVRLSVRGAHSVSPGPR
jgi:PAS domain S-box-containing protein